MVESEQNSSIGKIKQNRNVQVKFLQQFKYRKAEGQCCNLAFSVVHVQDSRMLLQLADCEQKIFLSRGPLVSSTHLEHMASYIAFDISFSREGQEQQGEPVASFGPVYKIEGFAKYHFSGRRENWNWVQIGLFHIPFITLVM